MISKWRVLAQLTKTAHSNIVSTISLFWGDGKLEFYYHFIMNSSEKF